MRTIIFIITFFTGVFVTQCNAQKNLPFDYPVDSAESGIKEFARQFKKGKVLYGINCAKCHSTKKDGKEIIPDFSLPQLLDYEIRVGYPEHQDPMREVIIPKEELEKVILFLQYKKRNDVVEIK